VTYHRRPMICTKDILGLGVTIVGSGCNLVGYYMYHGGQNPANEATNLQESRDTEYPNDYPIVSYDFQSPLGECGQYRQSYFQMKQLHSFLHCYGELLAPMVSVLPKEQPTTFEDMKTLRCAVRTDGTKGFLFVNHYERLETLAAHKDVVVELQLATSKITVEIPQVLSNIQFILPFNLSIGGERLLYALAQPVDIIDNVYSFLSIDGVEPRFVFEHSEFVLTESGVSVGTAILRLVKSEEYTVTKGDMLEVCKVENRIPFDRFTYLNLTDQTQEWEVKWNAQHKYLKIDCVGNVAQAYCGGVLVSDWFCNGTPWVIDTTTLNEQKLIIKVQPLTELDDIYFEVAMPYGIFPPKVEGITESDIFI
ncbi:MAG: beta-galactosidase, partial [Oscillospiraceae bacterium]